MDLCIIHLRMLGFISVHAVGNRDTLLIVDLALLLKAVPKPFTCNS